ncbi:Krueppel-like factor 12 isoform X1 [Sardina pilchardus]|uniref:Krueppel-like factor 12 isoform X1 n=1 Tax=Sardina pilchardus TaxID=27697 RepID=UPI002E116245
MTSNVDVSVSFLKYELASTIEQAVRSAVDTVLKETARVVGIKLAAARTAAAESHRENQTLRERLEISEGELKAVRYYMTAAEKNIKQCLLLNNQNQPPRSSLVRPQSEENLFLFPSNTVESNVSQVPREHSRTVRSFRNSPGRTSFSRTLPSVGLCLPTPQSEWPRSVPNRRRIRSSASLNQSLMSHNQAAQAPIEPTTMLAGPEEGADGQFFIADDGVTNKEYKGTLISTEDGHRIPGEQDAPMQSEDPPDLSKFEFEVGGAAGNVNELGLIQVLEDHEEVKNAMIKIEDDPEHQNAAASGPDLIAVSAAASAALSISVSTSSLLSLSQVSGPPPMMGLGEASVPLQSSGQTSRDGSEKIYRCNVCGRGFRRFYCLKTHQRIHTGERPYPCRYCEKRFRHLDSLHKHQRIHTGERPYRCAQCGCCFRELGQLKKHRLTHSPAQTAGVMPSHASLGLLPSTASFSWPQVGSQSLDSL